MVVDGDGDGNEVEWWIYEMFTKDVALMICSSY